MLAGIGFVTFNICGILSTIMLVGTWGGEDKFTKRVHAIGKTLAIMAIVGLVVFILKY